MVPYSDGLAGGQILIVNRRFLPRELRAPLYLELLLACCVCSYGFFAGRVIIELVRLPASRGA
jgi:hypothetical protein